MPDLRTRGATSNMVRFSLKDKTTGQGKTGLSSATSGLIISTIADNESTAVAYTQAGSTIESITTLGTFAAPTATKCRFKEVDNTNHKGLYEFQFADARFAVSSAKRLVISVNDAETLILDADYEIEFTNDVVAAVWDEVNTGSTHNVNNSTGKQLRLINPSSEVIYPTSGTVNLTAATSTTATLDGAASAVSQAYQWDVLNILTGTGAGQSRVITNYTTGRVATVSPAFTTTPDTSSTFDITPTASVQVVTYVAGQDPATLVWAAASRTLTSTGNSAIATSVWQDTTSGDFTVSGSIGKSLFTGGVVPGGTNGLFIAGTNAATTITTSLTTHFVGTLDTVTNLTNLPAITTDWLTGTGVAASAVTKIQTGLATPTNITAGTITTVSGNVTGTVGGMTAAGLAGFFTIDTTKTFADAIDGSVVKEIATNSSGGGSDPWAVDLPGSYADGTAGSILGNEATVADIVAGVWNELLTASTYNIDNSAGKILRLINPTSGVIYGATAPSQAGMTSTQIKLDSGASASDQIYQWTVVSIVNGTGAGQSRAIISYVGSTRVATVDSAWSVQPDNTSVFEITPTAKSQVVSYVTGQSPDVLVWAAASRTLTALPAMPTDWVTSAGVSAGAVTKIQTGLATPTNITAGTITTVSGNVTGTVGGMTAAGLAMFFAVDTTKVYADAIGGSVVKEVSIGGGSDPWATPVPGSYLAGTAGYILGNRLDVSVSSRSTYAGTDTPGTATLLSRIGSAITINGGAVAIDWAHVLNPTSVVALTNTTISPSQVVASVSGNVTGSIGGLTAAALAQFFTTNTTELYVDAVTGSVVKEIASNSSGGGTSTLTAADVWTYGTRTLTSLGATAPAGWINAASIVAHALDGKGDWSTYAGGDSSGVTTLLSRISSSITIVGGGVNLNLAQSVPMSNTAQTIGDAFNAARAQGFGRWVLDPNAKTLVLYAADGTTVVRTFNVDSGTAPLTRS